MVERSRQRLRAAFRKSVSHSAMDRSGLRVWLASEAGRRGSHQRDRTVRGSIHVLGIKYEERVVELNQRQYRLVVA